MIAKESVASFAASIKAQRERTAKLQKALPAIKALLTKCQDLASMKDLVSWSPSLIENYYEQNATLQFYLDGDHKNSSLVRDLVRLTGKPARKVKSGSTITAIILFSGLRITVEGYKPETCVLVDEPVEVAVDLGGITCRHCGVSVTNAATACWPAGSAPRVTDGQPAHDWIKIEKRTKIVCTPSEQVA